MSWKRKNNTEEIIKALLTIVCGKNKPKENIKSEIKVNVKNGENVKLFFNLGKKDNIKVKDIVGSIDKLWNKWR